MRLILLLFGVFYFLVTYLFILFLSEKFLECPYPEFLSWDGNLRFITALRMMDSIRNFDVFNFLKLLFDAPTWPTLRNLIQTIVFFVFEGNGKTDTYITVSFLILTSISFPIIFYNSKNNLRSILHSSFGLLLLFYSNTYLLYSYSTMLEVQGGLFSLLFIYFFYRFQIQKSTILPVFISLFLAFQTKYPYGYINIFFIIIYYIIFYNSDFYKLLTEYSLFLTNKKIIFTYIFLFLMIGVSILFKNNLPGKLSFYLKYFFILIFSTINSVFIIKNFRKSKSKFSEILSYVVVPILLFTILHPDRVGSSIGTISHIQSDGKAVGDITKHDFNYYISFFYTIYYDIWNNSELGMLFFIIQCFSLLAVAKILTITSSSLYFNKKLNIIEFFRILLNKIELNRDKFLRKNPSFIYSFYLLISLIGLTFLTPNHQSRHVFHLYPILIVGTLLYFNQISLKLKIKRYKNNLVNFIFYTKKIIYLLFFIMLFIYLNQFILNIYTNKFKDKYLCYGGIIDIYNTPLFFEKELPAILNENTFLINKIEPEHLNKVDTELVFSKIAYSKGTILALTEREYLKNKDIYKTIIIAERICSDNQVSLEKYFNFQLLKIIQVSNLNGCITKFIKK